MISIRKMVTLGKTPEPRARPMVLVLAAAVAAYAACNGGGGGGATTAASACSDVCTKQQSCGDIDSVAGDQCRTKCSADAQSLNAAASICLNESDILAAGEQCLGRACTDYQSCLTTLPSCLTSGGTTTTTGAGGTGGTGTTTVTMPAGLSCTETMSAITLCAVYPSSVTACPSGSTEVSSCPTANVLGFCTITSGTTTAVIYFYSTGGFTASSAQTFCTSEKGTWTPG